MCDWNRNLVNRKCVRHSVLFDASGWFSAYYTHAAIGYLCAFLWNMSLFYAIIWSSSWYACFVNLRFYFTSIFVSLFDSMKYDDKKNPDDVSSGCDICFAGALVTFHAMTLTHCAYVSISMSACAHNLWNFSICPSFTFWNHSHFIHGIVDMKL